MNRLLTANLKRLFKDRIFWLAIAAMFLFTVYAIAVRCINVDNLAPDSVFEDIYFIFAPSIGVFIAVICSMFIGTDYSDGTIKNKLIMGHKRIDVYLANMATMFIGSVMIMAVFLVVGLAGIPVLGSFSHGVDNALIYIAIMLFVCLSFSAIFTLISMNVTSKALILLVSLLVLFLLAISTAFLDNSIKEPEMIQGVHTVIDGQLVELPTEPNPRYVSGWLRGLYQILFLISPVGQCIQVSWLEVTTPWLLIIFSVITTIVVTVVGAACFNKKDLK